VNTHEQREPKVTEFLASARSLCLLYHMYSPCPLCTGFCIITLSDPSASFPATTHHPSRDHLRYSKWSLRSRFIPVFVVALCSPCLRLLSHPSSSIPRVRLTSPLLRIFCARCVLMNKRAHSFNTYALWGQQLR
jgi:hypothetical protein